MAGQLHARGSAELYREISARTAKHWSAGIATPARAEALMWRLLRILTAPYPILGSDSRQPLRLRIDTPWDFVRQLFVRALRRAEATAR